MWAAILSRQYRLGRPGGVADRVISRAVRYDVVPQHEREVSVSDLVDCFFELVRATSVSRFVEAGAKDAGASVRAVGELGLDDVVAFEANPYTHRRFSGRVTRHGIRYVNRALSDSCGTIEFLVRLTPDGTPMADGQASMLVRPDHAPGYEHVEVESVRLDEEVDTATTAGRTAIWVDVEGATAEVLSGASDLLPLIDVAMIEVEERPTWVGQRWLHLDVVRFMAGHGLVPVARDRQSRYQFNVVFVRDELVETDDGVRAVLGRRREPQPAPAVSPREQAPQ